MVYAIQIEGLDATELSASMGMDPSSMPKTTLGGKTVYCQAASGFGVCAYPKDDKLYLVLLMDERRRLGLRAAALTRGGGTALPEPRTARSA